MNSEEKDLEATADVSQKLTDEEVAKLKAKQKQYFLIAIVAGIILAFLGFFAGQNAAHHDAATSRAISSFVVAAEREGNNVSQVL
ncbi:hypothetical protein [Arcanobacterium phocae]|uniref:hypothetical protein n=1 Tax=Arcanobacterium phocae TaxID=131112 RepID=UPI001C0E928C|nr:hypothetical protein [Arcanobacterium phocae]